MAATTGPGADVRPPRLTTPPGTPASVSSPAMSSAVSGRVLGRLEGRPGSPRPAPGRSCGSPIAAGKFQGVTRTETPTGCRVTRMRLAPEGAVATAPSIRTASSAYQRKNSARVADLGPGKSRSDLPFSAVMSRAIGSAPLHHQLERAAQDLGPLARRAVAAHPGSAACAAPTASSASRSEASATLGQRLPRWPGRSPGSSPGPPVHSPPIRRPVGTSVPVREARSVLMILRLSAAGPRGGASRCIQSELM